MKEGEISRRDFLKDMGVFFGAFALPKWILDFEPGQVETRSDVLNVQTQEMLASKAALLISPTPEAAINTADILRNSTQSSADNICGPLAIKQLFHTVIYGVRPADYWLASPGGESSRPDLFSQSFPGRKFNGTRVNTSIAEYDFGEINLQPGDFLYLFARGSGSDHMITISRRGKDGILYCITNYPQADGRFIILEVPVWNPRDKNSSFMKKFARSDNPAQFSTGRAGFMLWRLKEQQASAFDSFEHTQPAENLQLEFEKLVKESQGDWHVLVTSLDSNNLIAESGSRIPHHAASVIKVPIAMAVISQLESEAKNESDLKDVLDNTGHKGRTFDQLLSAMLVLSEEDATVKLVDFLASKRQDTQKLIDSWGADRTMLSSRRSTAEDTGQFFSHIYDFKTFLYSLSHKYLLELLSRKTPQDITRLGVLSGFGVKVDQIFNKRGSIAENGTVVVADSGIVRVTTDENKFNKKSFFVSLTGMPRHHGEAKYETLETELLKFVKAFAEYCSFMPFSSGRFLLY